MSSSIADHHDGQSPEVYQGVKRKRPDVADHVFMVEHGEDDLGLSEDSESESVEVEQDEEPFLGNDMIDLVFLEPDESDFLQVSPEYTHQVFDEEDHLEEVTFMEAPEDSRVTINIRCSDYRHLVGIPSGSNPEEQKKLLECIRKALPPDAEIHQLPTNSVTEKFQERCEKFAVEPHHENHVATAPGVLIHSFQRDAEAFEVYLASAEHTGVGDLVRRAEALARWFIETADSVDFAGDNRWQVLLLYRRCRHYKDTAGRSIPKEVLSLAGYYTLYTFRNPFIGSRMRVCQALILPHHQGKGLGREMLLATYRYAQRDDNNIVEITVEDPAPAFQALRDACDQEWLLHLTGSLNVPSGDTSALDGLARKLCLTSGQVYFLREMSDYSNLKDKYPSEQDTATIESEKEWKTFRLSVKRRLLNEQPDIKSLPKKDMQSELDNLYSKQLERLDRGLKSRQKLLGRKNKEK